jgi:hypothetical protein
MHLSTGYLPGPAIVPSQGAQFLRSRRTSSPPCSRLSEAYCYISSLSRPYDTYTLWTVIDDTVYAHQDVKNDCQAGVKSMAVKFGDRTKPLLVVLAVAQVGLLVQLQDRRRR